MDWVGGEADYSAAAAAGSVAAFPAPPFPCDVLADSGGVELKRHLSMLEAEDQAAGQAMSDPDW